MIFSLDKDVKIKRVISSLARCVVASGSHACSTTIYHIMRMRTSWDLREFQALWRALISSRTEVEQLQVVFRAYLKYAR